MVGTAAPPARSRPHLLAASYFAGSRIVRVVPSWLRDAAATPGGTAWFWLNDAVLGARRRFGVKIVPVGRSAVRAITEALQSNAVVALVCDLEQGPGVTVSFFGRKAVVPSGPAAFALKTGAALIPI